MDECDGDTNDHVIDKDKDEDVDDYRDNDGDGGHKRISTASHLHVGYPSRRLQRQA